MFKVQKVSHNGVVFFYDLGGSWRMRSKVVAQVTAHEPKRV